MDATPATPPLRPRPRREAVVKLRASAHEAAKWMTAASEAAQPSLSAWLRSIADEAAATRGDGLAVAAALTALRADIARGIGNNLNQIARRLNEGDRMPSSEIGDLAVEIEAMRMEITRRLRIIRPPRRPKS